jgi:hypothetical protein
MDGTYRTIVYPPSGSTPAVETVSTFISDGGGQVALVSGTNIKTINGSSVLGSGNLVVSGSGTAWGGITGTLSDQTDLQTALNGKQAAGSYATGGGTATGTNTGDNAVNSLYSGLAASKQDTLVSATNIKTINGSSVLGSGDLVVSASATGVLSDLQMSILQSDGTLNAALGVQTWAGTNKTGQDVFTVAGNSTYRVRGQWYVNTGSTTHTTAMAFELATATVTDFQYQVMLWSAALNAVTTAQSTVHVSGVASKVLNATSAAVYTIIKFEGIMVIGTGGTVTPQINFSANPTGSNLMKRGSWTSFERLGADTAAAIGGWA